MSYRVIVNPSSINLVKEELGKLVKEAGNDFEAASQSEEADSSSQCAQKLQQIASVFRLLELDDAALLSEELRILVSDPVDAGGAGGSLSGELIARAILILERYPQFQVERRTAVPALLVDDINALRALRKKPALAESLFVADDFLAQYQYPGETKRLDGKNDLGLVRRLRHLYQVGLLAVIKGKVDQVHLRLMQRASARMKTLAEAGPGAEFWWLLGAVLDSFASGSLRSTPARLRLLASADRQFRACVQSQGEIPPTPELIRRELVYVASNGGEDPGAAEIRNLFDLEGKVFSDQQLAEARDNLLSLTGETVQTMVAALKTELERGKALLEEAASQGNVELLVAVPAHLSQVSAVLKGAGMNSSAQTLDDQVARLNDWIKTGHALDSTELTSVADAVLFVETSLDGLGRNRMTAGDADALHHSGSAGEVHRGVLGEAQAALLNEAMKTLEEVKRSITAYVEGGYDRGSLVGLEKSMRAVEGPLAILNQSEAAGIMDLAAGTLEFAVSEEGAGLDGASLAEGFADVLVCVEYFIGALNQGETPDPSILAMAEESLKAFSAPIA